MNIRQIPKSYLYMAIRVLCLVALSFASMLAVDYYFAANTFCEAGASCQVVAQSEFGQKYGKFLPTLGLVAYSFFFLTSFFFTYTRRKMFGKSLSNFWVPLAIICCAIGAMLFVIVQALEINAFCWLCMGIDTSALLMVAPAILLFLNKTEQETQNKAELNLTDPESEATDADSDSTDTQKKDKQGFIAGCWSDFVASCKAKTSAIHPVLWLTAFFACAAGPIFGGTLSEPEPEVTATESKELAGVPEYIKSFYVPGKINVVEISSFDCPHCRQLHPELSKVLNEYGDAVNFTRLTIPLGRQKDACVAYYCAEKQKKENQFAECLFKGPSKDPQKLLEYARECSIDESTFETCRKSPDAMKAVDDMLANIRTVGFEGAPTVWIESTEIVGYNTQKGMEPYRIALGEKPIPKAEKSLAPKEIANTITAICMILAVICLFAGLPLTLRRLK